MSTASLIFDAAAAQTQMDELTELLQSRFPEGVPSQILRDFQGLLSDVILSDGGSTLGTDGTIEIVQGLRFGARFESFRAAILAGKFDVQELTPQSQSDIPESLLEIMRQNSVAVDDLTTKARD